VRPAIDYQFLLGCSKQPSNGKGMQISWEKAQYAIEVGDHVKSVTPTGADNVELHRWVDPRAVVVDSPQRSRSVELLDARWSDTKP
jgi:hypothetical protein